MTNSADIELHEERLVTGTERLAVERVRISKRIVTTTRTIEVPVRVEQLVITHHVLDPAVPVEGGAEDDEELVVVLHEEVPEVTLRVVPVERVVIVRRTVADTEVVRAELVREHAAVVVSHGRRPDPPRSGGGKGG